jgi:hypothetical protein
MCAHKPPTGDPSSPEYIKNAMRIQRLIEERSDADNLDGDLVGLGFEDGDKENENGEITEAWGSDKPGEGNQVNRRLFENVQGARPLVRTPVSARRMNLSRPNDLMSVVIASMLSNAKSDEANTAGWTAMQPKRKRNLNDRRQRRKEEGNGNKENRKYGKGSKGMKIGSGHKTRRICRQITC